MLLIATFTLLKGFIPHLEKQTNKYLSLLDLVTSYFEIRSVIIAIFCLDLEVNMVTSIFIFPSTMNKDNVFSFQTVVAFCNVNIFVSW